MNSLNTIKSRLTFRIGKTLLLSSLLILLMAGTERLKMEPSGTIPNRDFPSSEVGDIISPQMGKRHMNQPIVFNGYAIMTGNAHHEVWDISDPYAPKVINDFRSNHASGEAESHQTTMHRSSNGTYYLATISGRGLDIWDMTDTSAPNYIVAHTIPKVNYGDVDNGIWGLSWQGDYIYVGATNNGIHVVDVSNLNAPKNVANLPFNQLGGVKPGPLFALGDFLVVTTPKANRGIATIDISDPTNPKVLDLERPSSNGSYIGGFYGTYATLINPLRIYDVTTDPSNIKLIKSFNTPKAEYVSFDDHKLFLGGLRGGTEGIHIYDLKDVNNIKQVGRVKGRDRRWDDQFSCPIGNMIIIADDQRVGGKYVGGVLAVHEEKKDEKGPQVLFTNPRANQTKVPQNSSIAISFSDWIEFTSVNELGFIVRPVNGTSIKGSWNWLYTTLSFTPDQPLQKDTTYEVVLAEGMITDLVGNPIEQTFRYTFTTGESTVIDFESPIISGNDPATLGNDITWSVQNPSENVIYEWSVDGNIIGRGTEISPEIDATGRYQGCIKVFARNNSVQNNSIRKTKNETLSEEVEIIKEAESALLSGNVTVENRHQGYSGSGYIDFNARGFDVNARWDINSTAVLESPITIRYANGNSATRRLNLRINNGDPIKVDFEPTGAWNAWSTVEIEPQVLRAGINEIILHADAGADGPNVDQISMFTVGNSSGNVLESKCFTQIIYKNNTKQPQSSGTIVMDGTTIWNVNPDAGTVTQTNAETLEKVREIAVGKSPKSLTVVGNEIWVVNRDSYSITIIDKNNGNTLETIGLDYASQPSQIIASSDQDYVYVTLSVVGKIAKIATATKEIVDTIVMSNFRENAPQLGGMAMNADGNRLYVAQFITKNQIGQVYEIDPEAMSLINTIELQKSVTPDDSNNSRGIANYLEGMAINPNGNELWVASKKDNLERGAFRDGNILNHQNTVRAIVSRIDLTNDTKENLAARIDIDNKDRCHSVTFSDFGDIAFVTLPGNNKIAVVDANSGISLTNFDTGKVPDGAVLDASTGRLFVHNFLSRSISAVDVSKILDGTGTEESLKEIKTVSEELLSAEVLKGKQLFYDASSTKLNQDGYMSCVSCHMDGSHDGQTWDFTSLGEGFRNTIDLRGKAGTAHGRLHWSANFDEIHDFENQIRILGAGSGLMDDADFNATENTLGAPKAGLSADLDALNAYMESLKESPKSPYRNPDGSLTQRGGEGKKLFNDNQCASCHAGTIFTDSPQNKLHDIGTIKTSSGSRLGGDLTGIDTPSLLGLWNSAPYLHDGSATNIKGAIAAHKDVDFSNEELEKLADYMLQLDDNENDNSLAVAEVETIQPKLFPNPTIDKVFTIQNIKIGESITIIDLQGGIVKTFFTTQKEEKISVPQLTTGIYFVKIGTDQVIKLIVK